MKKILSVIIFLLIAIPLQAKNLYVNSNDGTCSDSTVSYASNADSDGNRWCTLGRAVWGNANRATPDTAQAAQAGDTVLVTGDHSAPDTGTWSDVAFQPVNQGTSEGARITIRAVGTSNLTSTGTAGGPIIGSKTKNYITWDGFSINEANSPYLDGAASGERAMVMFNGSNYGLVKNCTLVGLGSGVADANQAAIFFHTVTGGRAYNNTISNLKATGTNVAGIYTYGTANCVIDHNTIYNSTTGIFIKAYNNDNVTIKFNKIYNTTGTGIRLASSSGSNTNIKVYQNILYNIGSSGVMSWTNVGAGCIVANNTIYNSHSGFMHNTETVEVRFYNNIVHTASTASVYTEQYTVDDANYHDFQHNVYYNTTQQWVQESSGQNWTTWTSTWVQDTVNPAGTYGTDPLLANIAGNDFRLCTASGVPHASCSGASPALTLGVDILDLDGDSATDDVIPAGAYITGNEVIGIDTTSGTASTARGKFNFNFMFGF